MVLCCSLKISEPVNSKPQRSPCNVLLELTSVLHHLPSLNTKQLCALAYLGYTREVGASK